MSVFNESINELQDSISSILSQTYSNFEFIILNDNPKSTKIKRYLSNINNKFKNIRLFNNDVNLGAALSRNKGINRSKGEFIAIMDADDIADKNRLKLQIQFLIKNGLDLVFPNYRRITINDSLLNSKTYNMNSIINQNEIYYIFSKIGNISINSGWLVRKKVFQNLNGYRNVRVEDYDFITRALIHHYKLGYENKILMSVRFRKMSIMRKNVLLIYLITKYLQLYLNKKIYSISIKNINQFLNKNMDVKRINRFNELLLVCHNVKYKYNLKDVIKLIYITLTTKFATSFIFNNILTSLRIKLLS